MKKLIALAFVGAFALGMIACGGGAAKEETKADTTATVAPDTTTKAPDTTKVDTTKVK